MPEDLDALARKTITQAATTGEGDRSDGRTIAQLPVRTTQACLMPGVWCGHQELWPRPSWLDRAKGGPVTRGDLVGEDAPAAGVWDLGVIGHERRAWPRDLVSARDTPANHAWLTASSTGPVYPRIPTLSPDVPAPFRGVIRLASSARGRQRLV